MENERGEVVRFGLGQIPNSQPRIFLVGGQEPLAYDLMGVARREGWEHLLTGFRVFLAGQGPGKAASIPLEHLPCLALDQVEWLAPIQEPQRVFAAAVNYRTHGAEANIAPPSQPFIFIKLASAFTGPQAPLQKVSVSEKMDYEVELGVMIGRAGSNLSVGQAMDYVAGYLVVNDISFRDLQINRKGPNDFGPFGQDWMHGKSLDRSSPAGPFLVSRDEAGDGPFQLRCSVNGRIVQDAMSSEMIFNVSQLIAAVSLGITLLPGDVISTGTPAGVALGGGGPFLQAGDEVVSTIEGIGSCVNRVVDA